MRAIFYLLIITFLGAIQSTQAAGITYKDVRLKSMPYTIQNKVVKVLNKYQFKRALIGRGGSRVFGYNILFTDAFFTSKIAFKYNLEGNYKLGKVYETQNGQVYHFEINGKPSAIFFQNVARKDQKKIIQSLKSIKVSFMDFSLVPKAYASSCSVKDVSTTVNLDGGVAKNSISSMLTSCLSEIGGGAEEATIGTLKSIGNGIANEWTTFWENPSKRLGQYWDFTTSGLQKVWDFVKVLGEMFINPSYATQVLKQKFGQIGKFFTDVYNNIKSLPLQSKVDMICNILGSIGVDVLITAITVGSGGAKLALTVTRLLLKITKISKMISKGLILSFKSLNKISDALFEKVQKIIDQGNIDIFNKKMKLVNCAL